MKKPPRLAQLIVMGVFSILASTWGAGSAHAETIALFTGRWFFGSEDGTGFQDQSSINLAGSLSSSFTGSFSFDGSISNYAEQGTSCNPEFGSLCIVTWSGVLSGGTVSFDAGYGQDDVYSYHFTGQITGGSFEGDLSCEGNGSACLGENRGAFSFASTSTTYFTWPDLTGVVNGWSSEGTLSYRACIGQCGSKTFGTLTMTTSTVPEPGSMTLLGAGIGAFTTLRRRRRSRTAVC